MTRYPFKIVGLLFVLLIIIPVSYAQLQFIENKGQWEKEISYKSDIETGAFFLQKNGFTVLLRNPDDLHKLSEYFHGDNKMLASNEPLLLRSHAYRLSFKNASENVTMIPGKSLPGYSNYFLGDDKEKWKGNCRSFESVLYKNIYPNIDLHYYTSAGKIKYDIIVNPGGNVKDIIMQYEGINDLSIKNNELIIGTSVGEVKEAEPYTYQVQNDKRTTVACSYQVENDMVTFKTAQYDPAVALVIDPTLIFASFTGSTKDNWGYTATPGPDGSFFAGGTCFGTGFPVSFGAFQQTFGGGVDEDGQGPYDVAIIKLSANGANRLYATYLGGSGNEQPHSMICDAQGNLVVAGRTNSSNFPLVANKIGVGGLYDIFITKFNAAGSNLIGSIKIGGSGDDGVNIKPKYVPVNPPSQVDGAYETRRNYGDDARSEVLLDESNNIYLASCTQSANFPVSGSTIQTVFGGGPSSSNIKQDGVILKFNSNLSAMIFGTFFGGSGNDACFVLAINPLTGNPYIAGATTSTDLPGNKSGALYPTYQGGLTDGFITEIKPDGSAIIKTTYIGTHDNDPGFDGNDMVYGIQFDQSGFPYIMGTTANGNWQALNATFSNNGGKQFIAKLNPDLSSYVYTTMFGTNSSMPNISPVAFLVDQCQNVYVSGWGGSFNANKGYPCAGTGGMEFLVTPNAIQSTTDRKDFFFFVLGKNATSQLFGSFFGQNGGFDDHVDGGTSRFDDHGILYQGECANCGNTSGISYPTTPGAWATVNNSTGCNQAAIKIDMSFDAAVRAGLKVTFYGGPADTSFCSLPSTLQFIDTVSNGKRYNWNFGDGSAVVTTLIPGNPISHTYLSPGTFRVMLTSIDSATCNIADTSSLFVKINTCGQSCPLSATKYTSNISGSNYQWQVNMGTGFTNISNSINYSGVNTIQLKLENPSTSWYGYEYRCVVDGVNSNSFILRFVNYWLGVAGNDWGNPANWSCAIVPDLYTDVIINSGTVFLNSNTAVAAVSVTPGATLVVNPANTLTIVGH